MDVIVAMKLIEKYAECPYCGNPCVSNGEGTLVIDDDTFKRTCKCGWSVIIPLSDVVEG
jgi:hypothetical protein